MNLSIVIPVFNESKKIAGDIEAASAFLKNNGLVGEIIIVDDGSNDGTTEAAEKAGKDLDEGMVKIIRLSCHQGKGAAVRVGVAESTGEYVMFADSGGCVPYENALVGLELIKNDQCDIAHGSRKLAESNIEKSQNLSRRIYSAVFGWFVKRLMGLPGELGDTQCGFKIYRGQAARQLYSKCASDGFMFDIEVILRAAKNGYRIKEFPIQWRCDSDSRLRPMRSLKGIVSELMSIKRIV